MPIDQAKLEAFMGKLLNDMGAAATGALVLVGDKLGLYKALAGAGPMTPESLAKKTGAAERYVREWLNAQAAAGYLDYQAESGTYSMNDEQAAALADETSPVFSAGAFEVIGSMFKDEPKITEAFRSGRGVGWHEHSQCLFRGTERFFRTSYAAHLVNDWLPALDGVVDKLKKGAKAADVGCGHGASTIVMAKAFPNSQFVGFDYHGPSIERANAAAKEAGVADHCQFEIADSRAFPGDGYDLVAFFDCLHDMGDPVGAAKHVRQDSRQGRHVADRRALRRRLRRSEPQSDRSHLLRRVDDGLRPRVAESGRRHGSWSAQAGEKRLREVVTAGGFTRFRRATSTPFNLVLEAKP